MALRKSTGNDEALVEKYINTSYDVVKIVSDNINAVQIVSADIVNVNIVGTDIANVNLVGPSIANVNIVAPNIANVNLVGADIANVNLVAADLTNVDTVATNVADVNTVAADINNGNITAAIAAAVSTASDLVAVASIFDQFDDIYLGPYAADPTLDNDGDPLTPGDIYWNTIDSDIRFYNGAVWERPESAAATSAQAALDAQTAAELALDQFTDQYLGPKAVAPTLDNDGAALIPGAMYWDTASNRMFVWNSSSWLQLVDLIHNYVAIIDPTINDDSGIGYSSGSSWINTITDEAFRCLDATIGAAVWVNSTMDAADVALLYAPLVNAPLTGIPTAPTAVLDTNTTQLATTAFVNEALNTIKWNGKQQLGATFATGSIGISAITALNATDIAVIDDTTDSLRAYRFDGATWVALGAGLAIVAVGVPAIARISDTEIAFIDSGNGELRTYRFTGAVWSIIGTGLSIASVGTTALTALNATDVALVTSTGNTIQTYTWNGSIWATLGASLSITGIATMQLTTLNSTDVVLLDNLLDELRTYRFNGATWSLVGSGLSIAIFGPGVTAINDREVIVATGVNDNFEIYRFNGTTWALVFTGIVISGTGTVVITSLNETDFVILDKSLSTLKTYRFHFSIGNNLYRP